MRLATPLVTLEVKSREQLAQRVGELVDEYRVTEIVVGLPKTLRGEIGPAAQKILKEVEWFKTKLECPIVTWDERLTTQEVERVLLEANMSRDKRKGVRDKLAAQRILQNYLDFHRNVK